jgi:hypothetical protein
VRSFSKFIMRSLPEAGEKGEPTPETAYFQ